MEYLWRIGSRKGTALPYRQNCLRANWVNVPDLTSDSVKWHYKHVLQKVATYFVSGPQETPKTTKLAIISMHGVSQSQ